MAQVQTMFVEAEAKATQKGTIYRLKEQSGQWVATNNAQLAALAHSLLNQPVTADINEVTSNKVNPHNGQPYVNRYLNSVAASQGQTAPTTFPQPQPTPAFPQGGITAPSGQATFTTTTAPAAQGEPDGIQRTIWAQAASKVAAQLLQFFPAAEQTLQTFDNLVQREIDKYAAHFKGNIDSEAAANAAFAAAGAQPVQQSQDDIPF
jgi:hypothetical protein